MSWTPPARQVTLNHMNTPAPHGSSPRASTPALSRRPRPATQRLAGILLGWLRFTAMAVVGVLGVWLLVLLFV